MIDLTSIKVSASARVFMLLLAAYSLLRFYSVFNSIVLQHVSPDRLLLAGLLAQVDSLGLTLGGVATTAFLLVAGHDRGESYSHESSNVFGVVLFASLVLAFLLTAVFQGTLVVESKLLFFMLFTSLFGYSLLGALFAHFIMAGRNLMLILLMISFLIFKSIVIAAVVLFEFGPSISLVTIGLSSLAPPLVKWVRVMDLSFDDINPAALYRFKRYHAVFIFENMIGVLRILTPLIVFKMLVSFVDGSNGVSYSVILANSYTLASLCFLPMMSGNGKALEISRASGLEAGKSFLVTFSAVPAALLMLLAAVFASDLYRVFFVHELSVYQIYFVRLFLLGCIVGLVGHVDSLAIRVAGNSGLLLQAFMVSEFAIQIGLFALVVFFVPRPFGEVLLGWVVVVYAASFSLVCRFFSQRRLR